jgi:hypothetical protein
MDRSSRFMIASFITTAWRRQTLESVLQRFVLWRRMDWCRKARKMVYIFARWNEGSDIYCKAVFLAWKAAKRGNRDYKRYIIAVGESFGRRLFFGHILCSFLAWHLEVLNMLLMNSRRSSVNLKEDGYCRSPVWRFLSRGFLLWRKHAADQRRGKLTSDLQMMVTLLKQASGTIEDLRIRLLLVRIFGLIRRQVFLAWRKIVEAEHARQIAEAAQATSRSLQKLGQDRQSPAALGSGSLAQRALAINDDSPDRVAAESPGNLSRGSRRAESPYDRDGLLRQLQAVRQTVVGYSVIN